VGIIVERPMYFTYGDGITGGHNVVGASALQTRWFFAEGFTGEGFDEYLTIMNPGEAGTATITYYVEGQGMTDRSVPLPARGRTTVVVHDDESPANPGGLGRRSVGHSTRVVTDVPVVIERPMYFHYNGTIDGAHNVLGVTTPRTTWNFAEGFTGAGFDEYLTILNPSTTSHAAVTITYYYASGGTLEKSLVVTRAARATVAVHDTARGVGRDQAVSARVRSTNGVDIVVERPMYFVYQGSITGGHSATGLE
jgi:hypothetical protein